MKPKSPRLEEEEGEERVQGVGARREGGVGRRRRGGGSAPGRTATSAHGFWSSSGGREVGDVVMTLADLAD